MLTYHMLAHQRYEERLRAADRRWRLLAEIGLAADPEGPQRRCATLVNAALRALARLRRPVVPRPA